MLGQGNWIKTAEVNNGDVITFKTEGEWIESTMYKYDDGNPKVDFVIKVGMGTEEKSMRLNKTNRDAVIAAYGKDTSKWVGKTAIIVKEKCLVAGVKRDCITLEIEGADKGVNQTDEIPF